VNAAIVSSPEEVTAPLPKVGEGRPVAHRRRSRLQRAHRRGSRRRLGRHVALLQYLLFRLGVGLCRLLPLTAALRLGEAVGWLLYVVDRPHRRIGLTNLRIAFPDRSVKEHERILRGFWLNLGRTAVEICHMQRLTPENVAEWVTFDDPEYWRELIRKYEPVGALILAAHFGNWELFAYAHGLYGYPVHIVYRRLRNPLIDKFIDQLRRGAGTVTVRKSTAGTSLVRVLKSGSITVIPADQNSTRGMGVFVDFFGVSASTNSGLARLAMRTGIPVFPAFIVREGRRTRHRIVVGARVPIADTGDRAADVRENTQRFAHVIEDMITRHPDHWFWIHKRWKTRPSGAPRIY
jgi:KDO2-lipid IV(A) lauroyltransferase